MTSRTSRSSSSKHLSSLPPPSLRHEAGQAHSFIVIISNFNGYILLSLPCNIFECQRPQKSPHKGEPERVYTEGYTCDTLLKEDAKIRSQPRNPDDADNVEYSVVPLMLWSDSTHLANFGTASLWPIYLYLGNLSKYVRSKPSSFAAQHLAYIPSVSVISVLTYHSRQIIH